MLQDPTKTTVDTIADCMAPSDRGQADQSASGRTHTTFTIALNPLTSTVAIRVQL